ncbi:hypothetical protein CRENBAI_002611 [Crenichthys baileyi]|uniref:Uncharacterized protein n=1 Tax=Crenichthys baileyi TaxID=28760 RepID=A0AAV9R868_9TELE
MTTPPTEVLLKFGLYQAVQSLLLLQMRAALHSCDWNWDQILSKVPRDRKQQLSVCPLPVQPGCQEGDSLSCG